MKSQHLLFIVLILVLLLIVTVGLGQAHGPEPEDELHPEGAPGAGAAPDTTITLYAVADAYVYSAAPATNYGAATTLYVGSQSTSATGRALFRFDLSAIPAGATVLSASFKAYLVQTSASPATLDVELKRIDAPW